MINNLLAFLGKLIDALMRRPYPTSAPFNHIPDATVRPTEPSMAPISNITATPVSEPPTAPQRMYKVAKDNLGNYLTLNPSVSPEVGCAQAVSWLFLNAGYPIPQGGISTVSGLTGWMTKQGFLEEKQYNLGFVITGRNKSSAHIGICGNEWIMSNTSFTDTTKDLIAGTFQANYRKANWIKTFPDTRYFRPI